MEKRTLTPTQLKALQAAAGVGGNVAYDAIHSRTWVPMERNHGWVMWTYGPRRPGEGPSWHWALTPKGRQRLATVGLRAPAGSGSAARRT